MEDSAGMEDRRGGGRGGERAGGQQKSREHGIARNTSGGDVECRRFGQLMPLGPSFERTVTVAEDKTTT